MRDDQRRWRVAVEQAGERVRDRRKAAATVDQDRDAPLGGKREDGLQARVIGKEALGARVELDAARAEVDAPCRLADGHLIEV